MQNSTTEVHAVEGDSHSFQPVATAKGTPEKGLKVARRFTQEGENVFDSVTWESRDVRIDGKNGPVFEQSGCEFPRTWSQQAAKVVASKYFRGAMDSPSREHSVRQLIGRVVDTIWNWGLEGGYFATPRDGIVFHDELTYLLLHQYGAFNSPVWFNLGVPGRVPQASACFINSVDDNMESITALTSTEARLFKGGSGSGVNLHRVRSSKEALSGGGIASGPVSFMRGWDAFAGAVKSGGTTRRAACMRVLNADHPDIRDFITCKADEERKAWALIDAGYDGGFSVPGGAYDSVMFQNANHSVRVSDGFMAAAEADAKWFTKSVTTGAPVETLDAREVLMQIAECTHICGDPGLQYDTTINDWHTCINTDRIYASNPCSEFLFLDDTACNLASLNLMKYRDEAGNFDAETFIHACEIFITAQEIIVSNASYPTEKIARNSEDYRPLGLGYANLGALLMAQGLAYDSDDGRALAGAITAIMTGAAYTQSARIAANLGAFNGYEANREPMLSVIRRHKDAVLRIGAGSVLTMERDSYSELEKAANSIWGDAVDLGIQHGYRNSQVSVLAPTGTIGFMLDCDTTGVEPAISLVSYKTLVGGGMMKLVNSIVPQALEKLGYEPHEIARTVAYIDANDTIEGAIGILDDDLAVFDCAFKAANGTRSIHYSGHIKMMAAAQPFISGAISKTVNLPQDCSVQDIFDAYMESWKLGIKAVAIYRDGSKRTQPLSTSQEKVAEEAVAQVLEALPGPYRRKLPDERASITHKFSIAGQEGYFMVGLFEDGTPGELFVKMNKEGSTISGLMDSIAITFSMALQYGVPLSALVNKFKNTRFEPAGWTQNTDIPNAKSLMDYIARWLELKFVDKFEGEPDLIGPAWALNCTAEEFEAKAQAGDLLRYGSGQSDAPPCSDCGTLMQRAGACYRCPDCGTTSGCG